MHKFFLKIPWWIRKIFPAYLWKVPVTDKSIYLTFDDGPHPTVTPWVLDELRKYKARATFFCVGENVAQYPAVYQQIIAEGHSVGNHTYTHPNGWETDTQAYLEDIAKAATFIDSHLFRPPYGRIRKSQAVSVAQMMKKKDVKIVMWDVLSADFDTSVSQENCLRYVMRGTEPGSIVVFHDSEKAFPNLQFALPRALKQLYEKGFRFEKL